MLAVSVSEFFILILVLVEGYRSHLINRRRTDVRRSQDICENAEMQDGIHWDQVSSFLIITMQSAINVH